MSTNTDEQVYMGWKCPNCYRVNNPTTEHCMCSIQETIATVAEEGCFAVMLDRYPNDFYILRQHTKAPYPTLLMLTKAQLAELRDALNAELPSERF